MTEEQIVVLTREVDNIIAALCVKHNASPLSLTAIINARLAWACKETDSFADFKSLIAHVGETIQEPHTSYNLQ